MELCFTGIHHGWRVVGIMPPGEVASADRWSRGLGLVGIALAAVYVGYVLFVVLFGAGDSGHGSGMPMGGHTGGQAMDHEGSSMARHGTEFSQSFGRLSLILVGGYLLALGIWAGVRRNWAFFVRHIGSAAAMLALVVLFLNARGGFAYNGHNWNRSFADASVVLFAATLAVGPLARLWRPAFRANPWRRETGIWATIAAAIHVGIFWEWSLAWDWRPFFLADGDIANGAFKVANVVGLVALVYALVLAGTSNDAAQRWLKSGWSWLQDRATTMWLLVLLHTWLFAFYITGEATLPLGVVWASFWLVLLLQTAAFGKTVWIRRGGKAAVASG